MTATMERLSEQTIEDAAHFGISPRDIERLCDEFAERLEQRRHRRRAAATRERIQESAEILAALRRAPAKAGSRGYDRLFSASGDGGLFGGHVQEQAAPAASGADHSYDHLFGG